MPRVVGYVLRNVRKMKFLSTLFAHLISVLLLSGSVFGQVELQESDIILVNRPVSVPFGRTVYVDPVNHLRIHVRPEDTCTLTVQGSYDLAYKAGRLNDANFPCNFGPSHMKYIHYGGKHILEDRIHLLLRYDSTKQTLIIPFSLLFKINFKPLDIVRKNIPLVVDRHMGFSSSIDDSTLHFSYDRARTFCKISVISRASGLPRYGYLSNDTNTLTNVDCDAFFTLGVRYKHHAQANAPNRDYIPMMVEIFSDKGEIVKQEYFQVIVDVTSGRENTRPEPSRDAPYVMDSINQFVMTAIKPDIVSAFDEQTPSDRLMYNISLPLGPGMGVIVSTDNRDIPVSSFFQHEIDDFKIAYKPPNTDSSIRRIFQLELTIIDTEGMKSDPITLMILVEPMNTHAPVVTTNTGIQLVEGQSRPLSPSVLKISDEDNLDDVKIYNIDGLRHGRLILFNNKQYFTAKDLRAGNVVYQHDDSDTFSDNIIFKMTDGQHEVEFLFPVTIYPKDDHAPTLNVNTGLEMQKNELVEINIATLSATDMDSADSAIHYMLEPPYSEDGILIKRQFEMPEDVKKWKFVGGIYEQNVQEFTQKDIVDGKIFYRHIGGHSSVIVFDKIHFTLKDAGNPPNKSPVYELLIKVLPVDDVPPYLYPNIKLQMELEEAQLVHFRRKNLRYTDDGTNDREIKYTISKPPFDTYTQGPADAGKLVYCEKSNQSISKFSQSEINHHKICYKPPKAELGIATRIIQFDFKVEDLSENVLPNQRYTIVIKPVNNHPPIVTNAGAILLENTQVVITPQLLDIQDRDANSGTLIIIVTRVPKHGTLYKRRTTIKAGDRFTKNDIARGNIIYRNLGENVEVTEDEFSLDVTDGIHHVPITFKILIRPTDDEPSQLEGNGKLGRLSIHLNVNEAQSVTIDPNNFKVSDPDTDVMDLTYMVRSYPKHGMILGNGRRTDRFTQRDIVRKRVRYNHTRGEIGMSQKEDSFQLVLSGTNKVILSDGSRLRDIYVKITIFPVDNIAPTVIIGPSLDVLEGGKSKILPSHLDVQDRDSNDDDILCTILTQPKNGYVENIAPVEGSEKSRAGMPISAFSIRNIRLGNVLYIQSVHRGIEPRRDDFTFQCTDGLNLSPQNRLTVVIHPANDEEPEVHVREFIGSEGMEIVIDLPILNAFDMDEPKDTLYFIITEPPSHGKIVQQTRSGDTQVQNFTMDDIEQFSTIVYEHDNSETQSDQFEFVLTDGKHNVTQTVPILIFPVDDETPRLSVNNGLEIEHLGDIKTITNDILKAEDLDSYVGNLTFIIRRVPQQGYLVKSYRSNQKNLTLGSNFTQTDIDNMIIQYVHTGQEAKRDLIKFDVTDGLNPLIDRYFYVTVKGMDMIYPEVINRGIKLPQGGVVTFTTDILSGTDLNSPDEQLKFTVTRTPNHGHLEFVPHIGIPITTFTQLDLAANRVRYVHNSDDEIKMDSFEFEVTDGYNPVSRTFRITLTDKDNKMPVLMFSTLRLKEGGSKLITPFELKAVDMDTPDNKITFTITQVPLHGNLLYNVSRIVSRFTLKDLTQNLITYQHDGTETMSDSFIFTVTDGTHSQFFIPSSNIPTRKPQEMDIEIIPVDNGVPQISINQGATFLFHIEDGIGFQFTNRILRSDDLDSPVDSLQYTLTVPPVHGYIRNIQKGKEGVATWTQGDIDRMQIEYILNAGENATNDSFFFKVSDKGDNVLANQPFHLNWGWISFRDSRITVNETQEVLEVTLLRRGFLGETCFITVNVTDRTASVGKDVSRQFAQQVQFNPGQTEKTWRLTLRDDNIYEGKETLILQLTDPVSAVLEYPDVARVTIMDQEDESTIFFPEVEYKVEESEDRLQIPIHRAGDLSQELVVICSTREGSAKGTPPNKVESFSDYISRAEDHNSIVWFDKDEDKKYCTVTVIDDSLYEEEEKFTVVLSQSVGGKIGQNSETEVIILPDKSDEPVFYFDADHYMVDESAGTLEVKVWKTGTDLSRPSSITVKSREIEPQSAKARFDYLPVIRILDFLPFEMTKTLQVVILDDLGQPHLEDVEKFELHLRRPVGGSVGEPSVATVSINDSLSDLPRMEFAHSKYEVLESENYVVAVVSRSGDISHKSWVRCYTRQSSAQVSLDYVERPDTNESFIIFEPGDREAECRIELINDKLYEVKESFWLVLGTPDSVSAGGATLGGQNNANVVVIDPEDKPVIKFEQNQYTVNEPIIKGDVNILRIPVIRLGDTSGSSVVRVSTKSGSGTAGRDFNAYSHLLRFSPGIDRLYAELEVTFDMERETNERFSIHLSKDKAMIAEVQHNSRATIHIEENSKLADVIFPVPPVVVSLRDLDNVGEHMNKPPIQGYPLVCVSPCNPKHPKYPLIPRLCLESGINDTLTKYRWQVGPPGDKNGVSGDLRDLEANTFFTKARHITLDSIYFGAGSRVRCFARAVNQHGDPGKELGSPTVIIDRNEGLCLPRTRDTVGADPFTAKLRYTGPDDPLHPNTVQLTIQIPHTDGMLPVVSTNRLSNFELTLSPDGFRRGQHRCSNLLDVTEVPTRYGFITNGTRKLEYMGEVEPYQYSERFRPESTLRFYKNLDMDTCLWTFESYYDMSELVSECGAVVETDAQSNRKGKTSKAVMNNKQSYVSLKVNLYVSYLYHSTMPTVVWRNFDLNTHFNLKFVYQTSILWQEGVRSPQDEGKVHGYLYPTSMRLQDDGRLVVNFRTEARYRGQFVKSYPGTEYKSDVVSADHPDLSFSLNLSSSDATFDQPEQYWEFVSDKAISDYSGDYKIRLLPCIATSRQEYRLPISCTPSTPVTFDLPIRFQQVSDPVPAKFSLNTQFRLVRKRDLWLSDSSIGFGLEEDTAFAPGDTIYGRVDVDPIQSLGAEFNLNIEKVFLCSGKDGYIPRYDPDKGEYGCVSESGNLDQVLRIVDAGAPYMEDASFNGMPFNALLASEDKKARALISQPGADGFSFDSSPMFMDETGRQWFLHIIYTLRSASNSGVGKRSLVTNHLVKRAVSDASGVGEGGKGTNMAPLILNSDGESLYIKNDHSDKIGESEEDQTSLIAVLIGVGILLLICLIVLLIFIRHRRKQTSPPPTPSGTITVMSCTPGQTRVISSAHYVPPTDCDNSEV